jgi:4-hydroxybenzoate polyprenyltransferase
MELSSSLLKSNAVTQKIIVYSKCMRVKEVILIGGVTFIGLLFNTNSFDFHTSFLWVIAMLSSYTLLSHAFLSNDWSHYNYDKLDINKRERPLIKGEISLTEVKILSILLLIISLSLASYLSITTLLMAAGVVILNYMYSGNILFLKSVPVISSIIHGIGATLGFLIGYTFEGNIDFNGIWFGLFFGIIYAAGHLNHEISDFESDHKSGIPTSPNLFGKKKSFVASFILFSISFFYIFALVLSHLLPSFLLIGILVFYPLYVFSFLKTLKSNLDYKSMIEFRRRYRTIFLLWGIFIAVTIIFNLHL